MNVDAERSVPRVLQTRHNAALADHDTGLSPPRLVARERDEIDPRRDRFWTVGSYGNPHGRRSTKEPEPRSSITGSIAPELDQLAGRHLGREADHAVVRGMNLQQERRVVGDRVGVVARMSPVRGADLTEHRAASQHDVGIRNSRRSRSAPHGDDDLAAVGERLEGQEHRGPLLCNHEGVFGTGQPA